MTDPLRHPGQAILLPLLRLKSAGGCRGSLLAATALLTGSWSASALEIRWAASSNRIYVTGPGRATLSDIKTALDQAPLELVSPGVWHLRANLIVEQGALLRLHGSSIGGDVDQLRLQSNNATNSGSFVFISADWGALHIQNTAISSWDDAVGGADTEHATHGRAFIQVRSSLAADGVTPLESRLDIIDSDVGYLGYDESEAYGLSQKVIGEHPDPAKNIHDYVNVYGDILNSRLHHNFYGVYTFGHYGGRWAGNEVSTQQGTALINPTVWTNGHAQQWVTQADSTSQSLTYTVGGLVPNRPYRVRKGGLDFLALNSSSAGKITFADLAGTTNTLAYSVEPASLLLLERHPDGLVISWSRGRLQRTTSLSPPDWQAVPVTDGQFSLRINPVEPMEFFRAIPIGGIPQ